MTAIYVNWPLLGQVGGVFAVAALLAWFWIRRDSKDDLDDL